MPLLGRRFFVSLSLLILGAGAYSILPRSNPATAPRTDASVTRIVASNPSNPDAIPSAPDTLELWLKTCAPNPSPADLAHGVALAEKRRSTLRDLIQSDPDAALSAMLPLRVYATLPEPIRLRIEQPFSSAAPLSVIPGCALAEPATPHPEDARFITRIGDREVRLYPSAHRTALLSQNAGAVAGIRIDDIAALRGAPVWTLDRADAEAAAQLFALPAPESGYASQNHLVGSTWLPAVSVPALGLITNALRLAETTPGPATFSTTLALALDNQTPPESLAAQAASAGTAWTLTPKRTLVIRADFANLASPDTDTAAAIGASIAEASSVIDEMTHGKTRLIHTVTPKRYRLGASSLYTASVTTLAAAARASAAADHTLSNYDLFIYQFPKIYDTFSGLGALGGADQWINGSASPGLLVHETGHNFGLLHANAWEVAAGQNPAASAGTEIVYGNPFDVMAYPYPAYPYNHYSASPKARLGWLASTDYATVSGAGTYRVYRNDAKSAPSAGRSLALSVPALGTRPYWIELKRNFPQYASAYSGALLTWDNGSSPRLLDMTPGSTDGFRDGGLPLMRTFSDPAGRLHITPVELGGSGEETYLDIKVVVGDFSANRPPVLTPPTHPAAIARRPVTFRTQASDPDGDSLGFAWDFGFGATTSGSAEVSHTFPCGGTFPVAVTVTDFHGGTATATVLVDVTDALAPATSTPVIVGATSSSIGDLYDVAYAFGQFVAVGSSRLLSSQDGLAWQVAPSPFASLRKVAASADRYVAVGSAYDATTQRYVGGAYESRDGVEWTALTLPADTPLLNSVAYGNGRWVAGGTGGFVCRLDDGPWQTVTLPRNVEYPKIAYGDGCFLATGYETGAGAVLLRSTDGLVWTEPSLTRVAAAFGYPTALAFDGARFLVSSGATVLTSSDRGATWIPSSLVADGHNFAILASRDQLSFALGTTSPTNNTVAETLRHAFSLDSANWAFTDRAGTRPKPSAAAFGAGRLVIVGVESSIETSGQSDSANRPPTCSLSGPGSAAPGAVINLIATATDPDGDPLRYFWDDGSGLWRLGADSAAITLPSSLGQRTLRVRVVDSRGGLVDQSLRVTVGTPPALNDAAGTTDLDWSTDLAPKSWFAQAATTYDGGLALASPRLTPGASAGLSLTLAGPGTLTYRVTLLAPDFLYTRINGLYDPAIYQTVGPLAWREVSLRIPAGQALVNWSYYCFSSPASPASGSAFIDQVVYSPDPYGPPVVGISTDTPRPSAGQIVTLTSTATGPGPFTYRWQRDDANLADSADVSGSATERLTLASVRSSASGSYRVRVTNAYGTTSSAPLSVDVLRLAQTITFMPPADSPFGAGPLALSASASSGLPVSFELVSGPATLSPGTGQLQIVGAGVIVVRALQTGDDTWQPAEAVERTFTVSRAAQTITFPAPDARAITSPPAPLVATASSGLPVTFALLSGPATLDPDGVTLRVTGTGTVALRALQPGDANYLPAPAVEQTLLVAQATQAIAFAPPSQRVLLSAPAPLSATASSGLPVTFTVVSGPATLAADQVTLTLDGAGSVVLRALQPGDATFAPAPPVERTLVVNKAPQTITFAPLVSLDTIPPSFRFSASTSAPGLPLGFAISGPATIDGDLLSLTGAPGLATLTASQSGDATYAVATARLTFAANAQTITFAPLVDRSVGAAPFLLAATASSGLPITFTVSSGPATLEDATLHLTGSTPATITITASQPGGQRNGVLYAAAPSVSRSFATSISPPTLTQTITFVPPVKIYGDAPFILRPVSSSGLPVKVQFLSGPATLGLDGYTLTPLAAGEIKFILSQPGDALYKPSNTLNCTLYVAKRPLLVAAASATRLLGQDNPPLTLAYSGFVDGDTVADLDTLPVAITTATPSSPPGVYPITLGGGADDNYAFPNSPVGTVTVLHYIGAYEALVMDSAALPVGKLNLSVSAPGTSYTGLLSLAAETSPAALKGPVLAQDSARAYGHTFARPARSTLPALNLAFTFSVNGLAGTVTRGGATLGTLAHGVRLGAPPAPLGVGAHTLVLRPEIPSPDAPLGSGHATATLATKTGNLTLSGKLADGAPLTATLKPAPDRSYRLWVNPHSKRLDSYLAGRLALEPQPDAARFPARFYIPDNETVLVWKKSGALADKAYRDGFGPLDLVVTLDPWRPPTPAKAATKTTPATPAITLVQRLGLAETNLAAGTLTAAFGPDSLDLGDFVSSLPRGLSLSAKNTVTVTSPVTTPINATKFKFTSLNPSTGAFAGTFVLSDQVSPPPAKPFPRTVNFSGVFRQPPSDENPPAVGAGFFLLPALPNADSTERLSGSIRFIAPAP